MTTPPFKKSALAAAALKLFPSSIRESLTSDPEFRTRYDLTEGKILLDAGESWVRRSTLFDRIRELLKYPESQLSLTDDRGAEWQLGVFEENNQRRITMVNGEQRVALPDLYALSPDPAQRTSGFDCEARAVNLSETRKDRWRALLASRALADEEVAALYRELEETPIRVAEAVALDLQNGQAMFLTLVPNSEAYYTHLVGGSGNHQTLPEFLQDAKDHIHQLISWQPFEGLLLSLLMSSHSSVASTIDVDQSEDGVLNRAYEWLQKDGDRVSQIGAIEIGLSILDRRPNIEPCLQAMIEQIRDDSADDRSRFQLLSALITLIEGELARTEVLRDKPVFWRRLASIAQASLIERSVIKSRIDIAHFSNWASQARVMFFYLQTLADLRREPRWLPDYVSADQIRAEFIGRILFAARQNDTKIKTTSLRDLLFGDGPESLTAKAESPFHLLPGPLEGGLKAQIEPPEQMLTAIEEQLSANVLNPLSFVALVNSALIFRLDERHAQLAAKALRAAKHTIRNVDNKEHLFAVLRGVAIVAAVTRSGELAEELRIMIRRCRHEPARRLSVVEDTLIGLIAAAAYQDLTNWSEFVGGWITDLAFESLTQPETQRLHFDVKYLCHIEPALWRTLGRAEAALSASEGI